MSPGEWGAAAGVGLVAFAAFVVAVKNAGEGVAWVVRWAAAPLIEARAVATAAEVATLRGDVATLRAEVAELRGQAGPTLHAVERLYRRLEGL